VADLLARRAPTGAARFREAEPVAVGEPDHLHGQRTKPASARPRPRSSGRRPYGPGAREHRASQRASRARPPRSRRRQAAVAANRRPAPWAPGPDAVRSARTERPRSPLRRSRCLATLFLVQVIERRRDARSGLPGRDVCLRGKACGWVWGRSPCGGWSSSCVSGEVLKPGGPVVTGWRGCSS
jgi:hypothetical protein